MFHIFALKILYYGSIFVLLVPLICVNDAICSGMISIIFQVKVPKFYLKRGRETL